MRPVKKLCNKFCPFRIYSFCGSVRRQQSPCSSRGSCGCPGNCFLCAMSETLFREFSVIPESSWHIPGMYPSCASSTNEPRLKEKPTVKTAGYKYLAERKRFYSNYAKYLDLFYRCNSFVLHQ